MASGTDNGMPIDHVRGHHHDDFPGAGAGYPLERHRTPDNSHAYRPSGSAPSTPITPAGHRDDESRKSGERNRSQQRSGRRSSSGPTRVCKKCNEPLTGQFVRALDGTFHLDCFRCRVSTPGPNDDARRNGWLTFFFSSCRTVAR